MNTIQGNGFSGTIFIFVLALCMATSNCISAQPAAYKVETDSRILFDSVRNRLIPVAFWMPATRKIIQHQQLVIVSHGYNANQPGSYKNYSFITAFLASKGYFVVSIQHELPTDSLLPQTGIPQVVRRTNWERGVQNILFVLNALKQSNPGLDYSHVVLIGHSNGGDMGMLFAEQYPQLAEKIISLDNRRVAFPVVRQPKIYSLRSSDQQADDGVLPTAEDQKKFGIQIIGLPNTLHNEMSDKASKKQRKEINEYIIGFLQNR